ncbi:hypothetical protein ACJX0J_034270, partial [Zea mays]
KKYQSSILATPTIALKTGDPGLMVSQLAQIGALLDLLLNTFGTIRYFGFYQIYLEIQMLMLKVG